METIDPRAGEASPLYADIVRELKIRTLDIDPELSLSLPIVDRKYAASAVGQLKRVLEVIEQPEPTDGPLTVQQAAQRVGVAPETIMGWVNSKQLKAANVGKGMKRGRYRIAPEDLDRFLAHRSLR